MCDEALFTKLVADIGISSIADYLQIEYFAHLVLEIVVM